MRDAFDTYEEAVKLSERDKFPLIDKFISTLGLFNLIGELLLMK